MRNGGGCRPLRVLFVSRGLFDERDSFKVGFQMRTFSEMEAVISRRNVRRPIEALLLDFEERRLLERHALNGAAGRSGSPVMDQRVKRRVVNMHAPRFDAMALKYSVWALESIWGAAIVAAVALKSKADIIHTHGEWATFSSIPASRLLRVPLIYDIHGVLEELFPRGTGRGLAYKVVKLFERICIRGASRLIVVSEAMKTHFGGSYDSKAMVVPCSVDPRFMQWDGSERSEARREMALDGRFVVAFSGSFFPHWQQPHKMAPVFKEIRARIPGSLFLVLTTDEVASVRDFLTCAGLDAADLEVRKLAHADVPRYLAAADAGLLIRARDIINKVASPVKFAEYLACGVPVLCTQGIGDVSDVVRDHGVGLVIDNDLERVDWDRVCEDLLELANTETRDRCRRVARDLFSWETHAALIEDLYLELAPPSST
ncbi:MAG: glycosyltransferase [Actinobacteria bacterium]|jgi:glycosyltransferase involved in cell wall biosynthesis|nr:MAG: glycosyltransferase [Actinomycetota bacterium]